MSVQIKRTVPIATRQMLQSLVDDVASLQNQVSELAETVYQLTKGNSGKS